MGIGSSTEMVEASSSSSPSPSSSSLSSPSLVDWSKRNGELPPLCVAFILSHTSPLDVCRLSMVSKLFQTAAGFDLPWERMLRHSSVAKEIIAVRCNHHHHNNNNDNNDNNDNRHDDESLGVLRENPSLMELPYKEIFIRLSNSIAFANGNKMYWLEKSSGRENYSISARALSITWGEDPRYWNWIAEDGSWFQETAQLLDVCWFEVSGQLKTRLQSGTYIVSFRIKMVKAKGWNRHPVDFNLSTSTGAETHSREFLSSKGKEVSSSNEWVEIEVGRFTVEGDTEGMIELHFSMLETEGGMWKSGLILDGAIIQSVF